MPSTSLVICAPGQTGKPRAEDRGRFCGECVCWPKWLAARHRQPGDSQPKVASIHWVVLLAAAPWRAAAPIWLSIKNTVGAKRPGTRWPR